MFLNTNCFHLIAVSYKVLLCVWMSLVICLIPPFWHHHYTQGMWRKHANPPWNIWPDVKTWIQKKIHHLIMFFLRHCSTYNVKDTWKKTFFMRSSIWGHFNGNKYLNLLALQFRIKDNYEGQISGTSMVVKVEFPQ